MHSGQEQPRKAPLNDACRRAVKIDTAIGLLALAPLVSGMWMMYQDPRFTLEHLGMISALYGWTMAFCVMLSIRKIRSMTLRCSAALFGSGAFASILLLSIVALPSLLALGVTPIATYWLVKMRSQHYVHLELRQRATEDRLGKIVM